MKKSSTWRETVMTQEAINSAAFMFRGKSISPAEHLIYHGAASPKGYCWRNLDLFFFNDGMVIFYFQGTIAIDGFPMVLPPLDHHHWMFFYRSTIEINGFSMVFPNSDTMVNDGFDLEKDLKMRIIVTEPILRQLCVVFKILIILLLVNVRCE